jgi:hypothetical protein
VRCVFWGGPAHEQVWDVPEPAPHTVQVIPDQPDEPPVTSQAATFWLVTPQAVPYRPLVCTDAGTLARRLDDPPTWTVYVDGRAPQHDVERWWDEHARRVVDGPVTPHPVRVTRRARELARAQARARAARRGPLP